MRCTWKNLARHCYSPAVEQFPGLSTTFNNFARRKCATAASSLRQTSSPIHTSSSDHSSSDAFEHSPLQGTRVSPPNDPQQLSAAQLAQAAAQAIRLSVNSGNLSDAFSILASIHSASDVPPARLPSKHQLLIDAIRAHSSQKGRVSSRLPAHSLLHSLIRTGNIAQASKISGQILSAGLNIRSRSLDAVVNSLGQAGLQVLQYQGPTIPKLHTRSALSRYHHLLPLPSQLSFFTAVRLTESHNVGSYGTNAASQSPKQGGSSSPATENPEMQVSHLTDSIPTQFALRLLTLARHSRQRRTRTFFRTLMTLCLINGEIILASLLFGVIIRDWQSRSDALATARAGETPSKLLKARETTHASREQLYDMCRTITATLEAYPRHSSPQLSQIQNEPPDNPDMAEPMPRQASLQALANLAYIVEKGTAGFGGLAPLVKLLGGYVQDTKRTPGTLRELVWVSAGKEGQRARLLDATFYFENVLVGMIHSISTQVHDVQTHNSLLHYILTQSTAMKNVRKRTELVVLVLESLRSNLGGGDNATQNVLRASSQLLKHPTIQRLMADDTPLEERRIEIDTSPDVLSTDMFSLIRRGNPQEVIDSIDILLPGLFNGPADPDLIRRALHLGPVVLAGLLDALAKRGHTGRAERVWRLAREAEMFGFSKAKDPWCLPIQTYTVMMCVYAAEARKAGSRSSEKAWGWGIGAHSDIRRAARPFQNKLAKGYTQRMRRRAQALQMREKLTRREMAMYMGIRLYLQLSAREQNMQELCMSNVHAIKTLLQPPVPDGIFFDALLRLINSPAGEGSLQRRIKRSLSYHRRRIAKRAFGSGDRSPRNGICPSHSKERPKIQSGKLKIDDVFDNQGQADLYTLVHYVVADMRRRGIAVPLVYRQVVGMSDDDVPLGAKDSRVRVWVNKKKIPQRKANNRSWTRK
ncbi:hypothetical protein BJ165DRAFT_1588602 [Panaeolus papilionaceus]|nr:hypothetical protein BJ165DRAFT_1588602 [Panaeolus papilionaceus]